MRTVKGLKRKSEPLVKGDVLGFDQGPYSQPQLMKRKKSIRPMAGRKNKEGREKAINDLKLGEVKNIVVIIIIIIAHFLILANIMLIKT